ncbi:aminotransferase class III-fold pyridoxal phosphate-dependent enzyme, partial [Streptomyces malaysiense]|uniref:aminotransferase class III-fold pyridoxal phosphate-dependent enzyme n=1 Tax=Streptomyces malaysiense TaxID=1428626 RepID=UPI001160DA47
GVGRTGAFWAVDHSGITPDVMVLSKAIGGSLPLAVIVYRDDLDGWPPGAHAGTFRGNQLAMAAGTATLAHVRENGLAERAGRLGTRIMDRLRSDIGGLACVGEVRGRGLMIGLELVDPEGPTGEPAAGEESAAVGRGGAGPAGHGSGAVPPGGGRPAHDSGPASLGARPGACGCDPASPAAPRPAAPKLAAAVQRECLRRGLIVELGGRHSSVVRLLPPLTISDEQTAAVLDRLTDAVAAVARDAASGSGPRRATRSDPAPRTG